MEFLPHLWSPLVVFQTSIMPHSPRTLNFYRRVADVAEAVVETIAEVTMRDVFASIEPSHRDCFDFLVQVPVTGGGQGLRGHAL